MANEGYRPRIFERSRQEFKQWCARVDVMVLTDRYGRVPTDEELRAYSHELRLESERIKREVYSRFRMPSQRELDRRITPFVDQIPV